MDDHPKSILVDVEYSNIVDDFRMHDLPLDDSFSLGIEIVEISRLEARVLSLD